MKNGAEPSARDWPAGTTARTLPCRPPPAHQTPSPNGNSGGPTRRSRSVAALAEPLPRNPCGRNRHADRQQTPQHGCTCGRVRRAHQVKSSDAALFFDVPGRHRPGMVVGFAGDATGKTWCARRTLPHVQSFLLIFHALKHRSSVVPPMRLRNRPAERQQPPQHGSTCGRVCRAHQVKSSDAAIFSDVPGCQGL